MVDRVAADTVILAPALVGERVQIDEICDKLSGNLRNL